MKLRSLIIGTVVIGCLAAFIFGKELVSYIAGSRHHARETVKEVIPPSFELSRLRSMLSGLDRAIEKRRSSLVDTQLQSEALEKELEERKVSLVQDRVALEKAAELLKDKQEQYKIVGHIYSYAEVDADARIKSGRFQQDKDLIAARAATLVECRAAMNDSQKILSDAEVERQRLANDIERLDVRATRLSTKTTIESGREHGKAESLGKTYVDIQKGIAELEHRLEKGERLFDMRKTGTDGIDYAKTSVQQSGLAAITEVLQ